MKYLWDTNIAIYYLQQQFPASAEKVIDTLITDSLPAISVISEIELLCWKTSSIKDEELLQRFIVDCWVFELDAEIKLQTASLRKAHKIKLPDAIIAATAMVYDMELITRNTIDFKSIPTLKLFNPFEATGI